MNQSTNTSKQRGPFKKRKAGIVLTKQEVKEIKLGRKKLRKQMRESGIKSRKEFELTASSLGLYFDKNRYLAALLWFLGRHGFWMTLAAAAVLLLVLWAFSSITELKGHFTISMSDKLFREGFSISETIGFENPTSHLFATPAEDVPCISVTNIHDNVDSIDGQHNEKYFAYTFYVKNEGENPQNMSWQLNLNSESNNVSDAAWVMIFADGQMKFYAKPDENGMPQMLPAQDDNTRGYTTAPFYSVAASPDEQYEVIRQTNTFTYWRLKPKSFLSDKVVEQGLIEHFEPQQVHKFTVVIWLEGDDPHCTDDLIGGHLGMDFTMQLVEQFIYAVYSVQ